MRRHGRMIRAGLVVAWLLGNPGLAQEQPRPPTAAERFQQLSPEQKEA